MKRSWRHGFTLVELLVVITIIGMLMALLIPAVISARARARVGQCTANLADLGKAVQGFAIEKGHFPGYKAKVASTDVGVIPQLFPFFGRNDMHRELLKGGAGWQIYLSNAICPADPPATSDGTPLSYVCNAGRPDNFAAPNNKPYDWETNGVFMYRVKDAHPQAKVSLTTITDGQATTLMLSENLNVENWTDVADEYEQGMVWMIPADGSPKGFNIDTNLPVDYASARPSSNHTGGFMVVFCDGHTQFMKEDVDYGVYARLMTPDGAKSKNPGLDTLTPTTPINQTVPVSQGDFE